MARQEVNMSVDKEINVVGKACPMPLIALAKEVRNLEAGADCADHGKRSDLRGIHR